MVENNQYEPSQKFLQFVKDQEEFKAKCNPVSEDPKGGCKNAIGYGHNIQDLDPLMKEEISEIKATKILVDDLRNARSQAN